MLRKEKIISHPTEGFAKIKSRGSRNKINKIPSQHPHVPEIEKKWKKGSRSASVFLSFLSQCWWQRTVCFPCVGGMSSLVTGWTFKFFRWIKSGMNLMGSQVWATKRETQRWGRRTSFWGLWCWGDCRRREAESWWSCQCCWQRTVLFSLCWWHVKFGTLMSK